MSIEYELTDHERERTEELKRETSEEVSEKLRRAVPAESIALIVDMGGAEKVILFLRVGEVDVKMPMSIGQARVLTEAINDSIAEIVVHRILLGQNIDD